jgi:hypothetical protein
MAKKKPVRKQKASARKKRGFKDVVASVTGAGFTVKPMLGGEEIPPPFPGHIVERLKEDAHADQQVVLILQNTAFRDLRAARAAQLAYGRQETTLIPATTNAERRIVEQLVTNVQRRERAAFVEIVNEWSRHYTVEAGVPVPNIRELKQLLLQARGDADREIVDNTAVGHFTAEPDGEDGDFTPFRPTTAQRAWKPMTELALAE